MTNDATLVEASLFPRLVVRAGGRIVEEIELRADLSIGRAEDNDLPLSDPKVSRHHARIDREGVSFTLTDLDSANGTRVNGVLLTGPHKLQHGERIAIGDTELTYQEPGRSMQDTLTSIGPPLAVQEAAKTESAETVPPSSPPSPPTAVPAAGGSRGLPIGLIAVAAVLLLAAVVVVIVLLSGGGGEGTPQATATSVAVEPSATTGTEIGTPVVSASPTVAGATPPSGGVDPGEVDDLLTQGEALARRSKFEDAIVIYEELTNRVPEDARPEVGWAWALILDDRAEEALPHAERSVELDPTSPEAAAVLARAYVELGEAARALGMAQNAVELDPGSARAHAVLAEALMANGQSQEAVDEADLALVQDINSADAHRIRGWLYHMVDNDMGRAASELQIAAGLQPELWLRRHELGVLLFEAEDYTTAILAFQDALGIRPKAVTYTAIGKAYYDLGQYDQARASFQQALSAGAEDAETYGWLAASYAQRGQCDEALSYSEQALALDPNQAKAREAADICQGTQPTSTPSPTTEAAATTGSSSTPEATSAATQPSSPSAPAAAVSGRIAFPAWNTETRHYDTYLANASDGSGRQLVAEDMHQPALSPDGKWLALNGEQEERMNLFIVRADGSGLKKITEFIEDGLPAWSSDGKSLAFSSTRHGDKQSRVYIIDEVPLEQGRASDRPLNFGPDDVRGEYPAWTPDNQIVYKGCDVTVEPAPCGLFIMSAVPGPQPFKQLTDYGQDTAPAVSGNQIAFASDRDGNWEIYVIRTDGTGLKRLTNNASIDGLPTWSPDGKTIAFVSNQGGAWAIWAMSPDGGNRRKLFDLGGGGLAYNWQQERIGWGP